MSAPASWKARWADWRVDGEEIKRCDDQRGVSEVKVILKG
jgi:hypothetical protein